MFLSLRSNGFRIAYLFSLLLTLCAAQSATAADGDIPAWLAANVGTGDGQIAPIVLVRARELYLKKTADGTVKNSCYFAMDATKAADMGSGRRFYTICESSQTFRAVPVGHGSGRNLKGTINFANGRSCVKNFGNAIDSNLTAGGAYITREEKTSFKGYYRVSAKVNAAFMRTFIQFDGEGEAATARKREIGGHPSPLLRSTCVRKKPDSPYADKDGMVPFGKLVDYSGGRSNGCTSWTPADARQIIPILNGNPATLYIYPESRDIAAARKKDPGAYWNATCLKQIGAPKYWSNDVLGPIIAQYESANPVRPDDPLPICKGP